MQHYSVALAAGTSVLINAHHWDGMLLWIQNTSGGVNSFNVFGRVGSQNNIQVVNGFNLAAGPPWPLLQFSRGAGAVSNANMPPAAGTIAALLPMFDNLSVAVTAAATVHYAGWPARG